MHQESVEIHRHTHRHTQTCLLCSFQRFTCRHNESRGSKVKHRGKMLVSAAQRQTHSAASRQRNDDDNNNTTLRHGCLKGHKSQHTPGCEGVCVCVLWLQEALWVFFYCITVRVVRRSCCCCCNYCCVPWVVLTEGGGVRGGDGGVEVRRLLHRLLIRPDYFIKQSVQAACFLKGPVHRKTQLAPLHWIHL